MIFCTFEQILQKMDLQERKIKFVQAFLKVESDKVISRLEKVLYDEQKITAKKDFKPTANRGIK